MEQVVNNFIGGTFTNGHHHHSEIFSPIEGSQKDKPCIQIQKL